MNDDKRQNFVPLAPFHSGNVESRTMRCNEIFHIACIRPGAEPDVV